MLSAVSVGGIVVRQVPAAVVGGDALGINLLGMSFLKRLSKFEMSQRTAVAEASETAAAF